MRKRRRWLIALVLLALLGGAGFWVALALREPAHGVTPEVVARIQEGMTPEEVEEIIGMPPGGYRPDVKHLWGRQKHEPPIFSQNTGKGIWAHESMYWLLEGAWVDVKLDGSSRVVSVEAHFHTPWQRVRGQFWRTMRSAGWPDF
jgi:hypothetical protein